LNGLKWRAAEKTITCFTWIMIRTMTENKSAELFRVFFGEGFVYVPETLPPIRWCSMVFGGRDDRYESLLRKSSAEGKILEMGLGGSSAPNETRAFGQERSRQRFFQALRTAKLLAAFNGFLRVCG